MKNLPNLFLKHKLTLILLGLLLLILFGGLLGYQKFFSNKSSAPLEEIDLSFDPEGPYAILNPRRDGNALILNIFRVASYGAISYELAYQSQGSTADEGVGAIDRGVQGALDTQNKRSDYSQEILFGTCSQGYTSGTSHCVFDKGIENGTLLLKIQKDRKLYRMLTTWHVQQPDIALGVLTSGDNHFVYKIDAPSDQLRLIGYTIVNDVSGVPKLPNEKQVLGKVYALNIPTAKLLPSGEVSIELIDNPPSNAKIVRYIEAKNEWEILDTKVKNSKLSAKASGGGIFAVLVDKVDKKE